MSFLSKKLCSHKYSKWDVRVNYGWYKVEEKKCRVCGNEKQRISFIKLK